MGEWGDHTLGAKILKAENERLEEVAARHGVSKSKIVRAALLAVLDMDEEMVRTLLDALPPDRNRGPRPADWHLSQRRLKT